MKDYSGLLSVPVAALILAACAGGETTGATIQPVGEDALPPDTPQATSDGENSPPTENTPLPPDTGEAGICPAELDGWQATLTWSGGFAGFQDQSVQVSDGGTAIMTDSATGEVREVTLSQEQLADIEQLLLDTCPFDVPPPSPDQVCADCFAYRLEVTLGDTQFTAFADDVTLGQSAVASLAQAIRMLDPLVGGQ